MPNLQTVRDEIAIQERMMDDKMKQNVMVAIVAFNIAVILFMIVFNMGMFGFTFTMVKLLLALVVGAMAAGIGFYVSFLKQQ